MATTFISTYICNTAKCNACGDTEATVLE